ncbi:MAG: ABC transporter substrate-binding protein [Clostridia bacterium]|nr:ABC transporter substrate-binding protein [Clostridia bacterium]
MRNVKLLCLCLALLTLLSACNGNTENLSSDVPPHESDTVVEGKRNYLTLLYSAADSFNPYTLKTDANRQIVKLLYEPLVRVNDRFEPINALADSVEVSGTKCVVSLKNARFSDGTPVTDQDVIYSYNLAKDSDTVYSDKLYEVESVTLESGKVVFNLTKNDPYFANVLDFPIIKTDSDTKTDSDSVSLPPIGCGRFKLNESHDGLILNENYFGKIKNIREIRLINAPDSESVAHYTEIGAADMYFTEISDGNITRMSGKRQEINLNNLVFLGINQNYAPLNERSLRQALSAAVDRVKLCEKAYYNNAVSATGFFHPMWRETSSIQNIEITANKEITIENLEEIGYNKLNSEGIRINSNGTPLKFTLLVNSENRIRVLAANTVAAQLKSAGIGVTVIEKSYDQYITALTSGNFQLYLGEVKFTDNMDVSPLFMNGGQAAFGLPYSKTETVDEAQKEQDDEEAKPQATSSQKVMHEYHKGNVTVKDVASVLQTEMSAVPLCYRTGVLFYNSNMKNVKNSSVGDIYFSIESYLIN